MVATGASIYLTQLLVSQLPSYVEGVAKLIEEASVGAGIEGVNKCEAGNSPPDTGGVAAAVRKRGEATLTPHRGGPLRTVVCYAGFDCFQSYAVKALYRARPWLERPPRPLAIRLLRDLLLELASTPPISGGELARQKLRQVMQ